MRIDLSKRPGTPQRIFAASANTLALRGTIENVIGTPQADRIQGNSLANRIWGGDGDDAIYGGPGNDWLFGEAGSDRLYGDAGKNVLLGGAGDDTLTAGPGRNLLIGGDGQDTLRGSAGDTILIGGPTSYDNNDVALAAILAEWSSRRSFKRRGDRLEAGINHSTLGLIQLKKDTTVSDDAVPARDALFGGRGGDWFFDFPLDEVRGRGPKDR